MVKKINNGKKFETEFMNSGEEYGYFIERFLDNNKFGFSSLTRFSSKNPSDCFIFDWRRNLLVYCELKTTIGKSFPIQKDWISNSASIHYSQINSLLIRDRYTNTKGIFVLSFLDNNCTYWITAEELLLFIKEKNKSSINEKDIKEIINDRQIIQEQIRKTKKYHYNIDSFLFNVYQLNNITKEKREFIESIMLSNDNNFKKYKEKKKLEKKESENFA